MSFLICWSGRVRAPSWVRQRVAVQANVSLRTLSAQRGRNHQRTLLAQDAHRAVPHAMRDESFAEAARKRSNPPVVATRKLIKAQDIRRVSFLICWSGWGKSLLTWEKGSQGDFKVSCSTESAIVVNNIALNI